MKKLQNTAPKKAHPNAIAAAPLLILLMFSAAPSAVAITDPTYLQEKAEVSAEQAQDRAEALAGIEAAQAAAEMQPAPVQTVTPAAAPAAAPAPTSRSTSSASSEGKVLGVSTTREEPVYITPAEPSETDKSLESKLNKNYNLLSRDLDDLRAEVFGLKTVLADSGSGTPVDFKFIAALVLALVFAGGLYIRFVLAPDRNGLKKNPAKSKK